MLSPGPELLIVVAGLVLVVFNKIVGCTSARNLQRTLRNKIVYKS